MQQTLRFSIQSKIPRDKTTELSPKTWAPYQWDKTPIEGGRNNPQLAIHNIAALHAIRPNPKKIAFQQTRKLPILPEHRFYRWDALPLLGKLYPVTLARQDLRCHRADKSLHSPTLSHRSHIGQQAPTRQD